MLQPSQISLQSKMTFANTASIVVLASALPLASAWGTLGHETVAYIATNFGKLIPLNLQDEANQMSSQQRDQDLLSNYLGRYYNGLSS